MNFENKGKWQKQIAESRQYKNEEQGEITSVKQSKELKDLVDKNLRLTKLVVDILETTKSKFIGDYKKHLFISPSMIIKKFRVIEGYLKEIDRIQDKIDTEFPNYIPEKDN